MTITKEKLSKAVESLKKRLCCERPVAHYCRDICLENPDWCDVAIAIEAMETLQNLLPLLQLDTDIVLPIIRCKDCKHFDDDDYAEGKKKCFCYIHGEFRPMEYFCASAERREK